jgi:ABC-type xylose transport system substrate-binding protein
MKITLTLMIQTVIDAKDEEEYEKKRDALIKAFEQKGYTVDVESEDGDDEGDEEGDEEE